MNQYFLNLLPWQTLCLPGVNMTQHSLLTLSTLPICQGCARKSKAEDHITYLERRLETWQEGDLNELLGEGRTIQQRLSKASPPFNKEKSPFIRKLVWCSRVKLRLHFAYSLNKGRSSPFGRFYWNWEWAKVRDILLEKHPPSKPVHHDTVINDDPTLMFTLSYLNLWMLMWLDLLNYTPVEQLDLWSWHTWLCTSFKTASFELCHSLALTAKCLCTELVDPGTIAPLMASRLIALDTKSWCPPHWYRWHSKTYYS